MPFVVAALYQFAPLDDYRELREPLLELCLQHGVRGSLLLVSIANPINSSCMIGMIRARNSAIGSRRI